MEYDDEALFKEYKVPGKRLRLVHFKEGDRVECNFKGEGKWHIATVSMFREEEGTYNVEYDDEALFKEYKVHAKRLRKVIADAATTKVGETRDADPTEEPSSPAAKAAAPKAPASDAPKTPTKAVLTGIKAAAAAKKAAGTPLILLFHQPKGKFNTLLLFISRCPDSTPSKNDEKEKTDKVAAAKEIATFLQSKAVGMTAAQAKKSADAAGKTCSYQLCVHQSCRNDSLRRSL